MSTRLPPPKPYHPTTFLERGVAVPFTTPLLAGTRARPAEKKGLELVIPNPAGGRGVYIMGWNGITSLCSPTLHDRQLSARIGTEVNVTPSIIRRVAREVAAEGLAGEEAMNSARKANVDDTSDRLLANYLLLVALVEQVDAATGASPEAPGANAAEMQKRARHAVEAVAPRIGQSVNWIGAALEAIADSMASIGVATNAQSSRMTRLVTLLGTCSSEIADWSRGQQSSDQASYAEMICSVADCTLTIAQSMLNLARGLIRDVPALLRKWATDPAPIIRQIERPEWLLDGWEQICFVWKLATDDAERRAALIEMAQMIPVLPKESRQWLDLAADTTVSMQLRRMIPLNEDWRTGSTVLDLIARNEHIRALTC